VRAQEYEGQHIRNPWELLDIVAINPQLSGMEFLRTYVDIYIHL